MKTAPLVYPETDIPFLEEQARFAIFPGVNGARLAIFYPSNSAFSGLLFEPISLEFRKVPIAQSKESNVRHTKFSLPDLLPRAVVVGQAKALRVFQDVDQRLKTAQKEFHERISAEINTVVAALS